MLAIEQALRKIFAVQPTPRTESVDLLHARGRVLWEDIPAPWDFPRFDYAAMDGYALRHADVVAATPENPIALRVTQEIPAAHWPEQEVKTGEAARIFTGAPIPPGADAVLMQEKVTRDGDIVHFSGPVPKGEAIRRQGEDMTRGERLLHKGQVLSAGEIGALASVGRATMTVTRRPEVAILSCGNELVPLHESPKPGQIIESNRYALHHQVEEAGGRAQVLPLVPDQADLLRTQLQDGLRADILITSGGASVGDYDLIQPTLKALGVTIHFWKVAIKPGKPVMFGTLTQGTHTTLIFGLPGNPASSMVTFALFVRPAIRQLLGFVELHLQQTQAILTAPAHPTKGRTHFVRGQLDLSTTPPQFTPLHSQSSGNLLSMRCVNAMAELAPGHEAYPAGQQVKVWLWP